MPSREREDAVADSDNEVSRKGSFADGDGPARDGLTEGLLSEGGMEIMSANYSGVRSPFIRSEIERTAWEDRRRVDDLIRLDDLIDAPYRGHLGGMAFHHLKKTYPREYLRLLRERGVERLRAGIAELRRERAEQRKFEALRRSREEAAHEDWHRAGGRL